MDLESLENCIKSLLKIVRKFILTEVAKAQRSINWFYCK